MALARKMSVAKIASKELESEAFATGVAYRVKGQLRWIWRAETSQAARWRATNVLKYAHAVVVASPC